MMRWPIVGTHHDTKFVSKSKRRFTSPPVARAGLLFNNSQWKTRMRFGLAYAWSCRRGAWRGEVQRTCKSSDLLL